MFERFKTGAKRPIQAYLDKVYNHGKGLTLTQGNQWLQSFYQERLQELLHCL